MRMSQLVEPQVLTSQFKDLNYKSLEMFGIFLMLILTNSIKRRKPPLKKVIKLNFIRTFHTNMQPQVPQIAKLQ